MVTSHRVKLAEQVVVLGASSLTLIHLNKHFRLVVGVGGENFRFLVGTVMLRLMEQS